ncbi:hypothetical protein D3C80_1813360 [compost metagenome]
MVAHKYAEVFDIFNHRVYLMIDDLIAVGRRSFLDFLDILMHYKSLFLAGAAKLSVKTLPHVFLIKKG